ncbi:hypothetical protein KSP40_PGU000037 [Platanthera guangdongensis]|uniref:Timeless N-terminal domain-containing protein n=1 Tax=Platanthera guangdongensis TaxID=2320717 RepID=A0ABR2LTU7_9ASPA
MSTEGLGILCSGLGIADEDDNGNVRDYRKTEYCLGRHDDAQLKISVLMWNTLSRDLVPIIEHYQSDSNLVINVVKILVFLTMPVDPTSEGVAQQIEYLWYLKASLTRNVTIAVIVSLLEQPLSNLESGDFTEDDWKLVQLVLTLFRNILAIQCITAQQKASGCANHFFHLTEKFLELMFQENIMDLILVLAQHVDNPDGYLRQDNLLLLEIFHYILLGQDPDLVAKASTINSKAPHLGRDLLLCRWCVDILTVWAFHANCSLTVRFLSVSMDSPSSSVSAPTLSSSSFSASGNLGPASKLTGPNYPDWSVFFIFLLRSQRKRHHLTDDPPSNSATFDDWDATDALVRTWLANSLSEECLPIIRHDPTVKAA